MKNANKAETLKRLMIELRDLLSRHSPRYAALLDDYITQLCESSGESLHQQYMLVARSYWHFAAHKHGFSDYYIMKPDRTPDAAANEELDRLRQAIHDCIGDDHFAEGQLLRD
jgi:hypothetical protein